MFNRSKKYILLLCINIIVVVVYYVNTMHNQRENPFDTEFVYALMKAEKKLSVRNRDLEFSLSNANEILADTQTQLQQSQQLILTSEQKYRRCESEKTISNNELLSLQSKTNSCLFETNKANTLESELLKAQSALGKLEREYANTKEQLLNTNNLLTQAQNTHKEQLRRLEDEIAELENAVNAPIALAQHYLNARFCDKPKFDERICVNEFLVRPTFSKTPITRVVIELIDAQNNAVIQGEYNSAKSQLYRLIMSADKELPAGQYKARYRIDNQTLISESVVLSQK